ncbi:MAG: hypothetical protein V4753_11680 [Pseudomonadota bacterium]
MKPTFALDLTREAIGLLHRTPKGWLSIGEVAFDAPDLAEALDYLRKTALGLSPMGVATKLILPNSQILYTEVHAPGPSRDEKRRQIAAALEGRTPYAVEDLVYDWSGKGATVKVAVIAKETLAEAEGFAVEHRLNPVSFVAVPEEGTFVGEPWFGPTAAAAGLLAEDESVERDREPVTILHRELPKAEPAAAPAEAPVNPAVAAADDDPLPGLEEALNADLTEIETTAVSVAADPAPDVPDDIAEDDLSAGMAEIPETSAAGPSDGTVTASTALAEIAEIEIATAPVAASPAPPPPAPAAGPEPESDEAPFAHVTDTAAFPEADDDRLSPATPRRLVADADDDDLPPAPSAAAMLAFASRRAAAAEAVTRPMDGVTRSTATAPVKGAIARPAPSKGYSGLVTAPSIPGTRARTKAKGGDISRPAVSPTTVKSPTRPGGTFGAALPAKKRTGIVFMVLIGLLLLFLALIGLWSSMYLGGSAPADEAAATEVIPDASDEMLADMQDPEGMTDPLPEADLAPEAADAGALATESLPVNIGGDDAAETADAAVAPTGAEAMPDTSAAAAPEPAPGTTVATDLSAAVAPVEDQDEIFLSAMGAPPPALDALALPVPTDVADALPDPVMPPPAPGTVYRFDARGLLVPTPEGIISPDGVMLIAGRPPVVPPPRSAAAATAAATAASAAAPVAALAVEPPTPADASLVTATETAPEAAALPAADPAMAGFRPRPRPEGLSPATAEDDDASLGAADTTDFAVLRPLPRPASVATAAAAVLPASAAPADLGAQGASLTAQAEAKLAEAAALEAQNPSVVAISMRPATRPRDMSSAVEAAVAAAVREPAPEAEAVEVAAAAPEAMPQEVDELDEPETTTVAPSIPTRANVAKQATYANAINLSKINLIGTYGTDSRRYALIRQSNGKYKKVRIGDRIDGGTVKAITDSEVRYQKGGRLVSLKMPKA